MWILYCLSVIGAASDFEKRFIDDLAAVRDLQRIDYVVLNAGILKYPNVSVKHECLGCVIPNGAESNRNVSDSFSLLDTSAEDVQIV